MNDILKLAETVQQMRSAQKEYFRTRSSLALATSKKLEAEVDALVSSVVKPAAMSQGDIFGKLLPEVHADLKHETKFCMDNDIETNQNGVFLYFSASGHHQMNLLYILSDYRDFLINQGIVKDFQRA